MGLRKNSDIGNWRAKIQPERLYRYMKGES